MTCPLCQRLVSAASAGECGRVGITERCSRCLCEFLMPKRERSRRGSRRGGLATSALRRSRGGMDWHERKALRLIKTLSPEQLELFIGWQKKCIRLGVMPSAEDAFDYLSELKEAA
jgi:hypothetical protein